MFITIDLGERRHIRLLIHSCKNEEFQLLNVRYKLFKMYESEPEEYENANVVDHLIDVVVEPPETGIYVLKVSYQIADEVLIDTVQIKVI